MQPNSLKLEKFAQTGSAGSTGCSKETDKSLKEVLVQGEPATSSRPSLTSNSISTEGIPIKREKFQQGSSVKVHKAEGRVPSQRSSSKCEVAEDESEPGKKVHAANQEASKYKEEQHQQGHGEEGQIGSKEGQFSGAKAKEVSVKPISTEETSIQRAGRGQPPRAEQMEFVNMARTVPKDQGGASSSGEGDEYGGYEGDTGQQPKFEDADDEIEVLTAERIFKPADKTEHMESGGERLLFELSQKMETQIKRAVNANKHQGSRIEAALRNKGSIGRRLVGLEEQVGQLMEGNRKTWDIIEQIFANLGWPYPGQNPDPMDGDFGAVDEQGNPIAQFEEAGAGVGGQQIQQANADGDEQGGFGPIERVATAIARGGIASCKEWFHGKDEEDIDRFLDRFEIWYEMSGLPEDKEKKGMMLTMQLKGRAEKVIGDLGKGAYKDYDKLKQSLQTKFRKGVSQQLAAKSRLEAIRYESYDKFADFIEELSDQAKVAYPKKSGSELDERVFEAAMNALPADFKLEMKSHMVESLDQMLDKAPAVEAYIKEFKGQFKGRDEGGLIRVKSMEVLDQANYAGDFGRGGRGQWMRGGRPRENAMRRTDQRWPRNPTCVLCGNRGHIARDCRNQRMQGVVRSESMGVQPRMPMYQMPQMQWMGGGRQQGDHRSNSVCFACQGTGHFAYECPSKRPEQQMRQGGQWHGQGGMMGMVDQFGNMGLQPNRGSQLPPSGRPFQYQRQQGPYRQNTAMQVDPQQGSNGPTQQVNSFNQKGPMTREECAKMQATCDRLMKKFYPRDDEDESDQVAAAEQYVETAVPKEIPVEKRLAVIPVKVNGVCMTALYDTGASISIAGMSVARMAGIELEDCNQRIQAFTGDITVLPKKGSAEVKIGNQKRTAVIGFVNDEELSGGNHYDMILGVHTLKNFPAMALDSKNRTLTIMDNVGMVLHMRTKGELLLEQGCTFEGVSKGGVNKEKKFTKHVEYVNTVGHVQGESDQTKGAGGD